MNQCGLAIGVLAASTKQLGELNLLLRGAGFSIAFSLEIRDAPLKELPQADVWVVNLDLQEPRCQAVWDQLESRGTPVIFEEDIDLMERNSGDSGDQQNLPADVRLRKERRIAQKLQQLVLEAKPSADTPMLARAQKVWVLAASTGGPEAVAQFLSELPDDLSDLAILYAQHIETSALENLRKVINKACKWHVQFTDKPQVIRERTIYVLSPAHQVELSDAGVLSPLATPWGGRFRPSLDQVIAKVARIYKQRGGVIVFTGMGDDGANSCSLMHHRGGQVWIQSLESCTIDSMPASVHKRGFAKVSAAPKELGKQFVDYHRSH